MERERSSRAEGFLRDLFDLREGQPRDERDVLQRKTVTLPEHPQRGLPAVFRAPFLAPFLAGLVAGLLARLLTGLRDALLDLHLHHLGYAGRPEDFPVRLIIHVDLPPPKFILPSAQAF